MSPLDEVGEEARNWNTKALPQRVVVDVFAAACAGGLVAPLITMIDKGIIENASGKATLKDSIVGSLKTLLLRPHKFIFSKPFFLIYSVYGGTYIMANTVDTTLSTIKSKPASTTTHGTAKFIGTSTSNLGLSIWKDAHLTKLFSTSAPGRIPGPTYALFALRDSFTIFASFNLPAVIAPHIRTEFLPSFMKKMNKQSIAQFLAPAAIQVLSTPVHLLGLDMYNRKNLSLAERFKLVRTAFFPSWMARICRIVPAFGVGGVVNTSVRSKLMRRFE
ncbi:hypothetical protein BT63DRAFT_432439 [Microthyrium microscopicum]|uniref:Sequence orphan n=1 Tax=Microthyrium microscopicum TaxID=703497 RepID=A0A6A6UIB9_9PEZI|nr:hypothetical protein BT63DRAFT_432439 [Microthyrium microscopicum]